MGRDARTIPRPAVRSLVSGQLTDEWRECQKRVSALERDYAEAMTAYCRGDAPPPPKALLAELFRMHKEAQRLLTAALAEIDRRMREQDRKVDGL